jgi:hypothetical protein
MTEHFRVVVIGGLAARVTHVQPGHVAPPDPLTGPTERLSAGVLG